MNTKLLASELRTLKTTFDRCKRQQTRDAIAWECKDNAIFTLRFYSDMRLISAASFEALCNWVRNSWDASAARRPWKDRHSIATINGRQRACVIRTFTGSTQAEYDAFLASRFTEYVDSNSEFSGKRKPGAPDTHTGEQYRFVLA